MVNNEKKIKRIGILPCSGACNVGVLTSDTVKNMVEKKPGIQYVCALGLPLGIPGIIETARQSDIHVALNGCEVKCASKALQSANIQVNDEITLTSDLKIPKKKELRYSESEFSKTIDATEEKIKSFGVK